MARSTQTREARIDWSGLTAIYGGRFDPPHWGHLEAALGILEQPGVRQVVLLPLGESATRPTQASAHDRVEMARLLIARETLTHLHEGSVRASEWAGRLHVSDWECRPGSPRPTYTVDTLPALAREYEGRIAFVIGTDQFAALDQWHRARELLELCHWIVLARRPSGGADWSAALERYRASGWLGARLGPGSGLDGSLGGAATPGGRAVVGFETPAREISSTAIRRALALGQLSAEGPLNHVPPAIQDYWKRQHLYGS